MRNFIGPKVKLARYRAKPKVTQEQLASRLQLLDWDIDRVGIARIETGISEVTDFELEKLAKALGVRMGWLLGEVGDKEMMASKK